MIGVKRMDKTWTDEFYREMDADKRLVLLKENIESNQTEEDAFRKKLWIARYGRKKPKKDAYVGCLMELKYLAEGGTLDIGGKKKRQAARIAADMYLNSPEVQEDRYREILQEELKHVFLKFMEVSSQGRGFTSLVFGMGQLSDEGVIKKIAEQISTIAFQTPHMFHMDREFYILQQAALSAFREEYPNREHFLKK
ncbi:MAG: DUF6553 family protein [Lachnospiraceae bacterium]|nr:DUF6553 family protein [Lachnospiraceae bacterium]